MPWQGRSPRSRCRPCWSRRAAISATTSAAIWCNSSPGSDRLQTVSLLEQKDPAVADMSLMRVLLFPPATHPEYIAKAAASGADGLVVDLEDGVALDSKDRARANLLAVISQPRPTGDRFTWCVRLNHIETRPGLADLLALAGKGDRFDAVMLPKVESPHEVAIAARHLAATS